MHIQTDTHGQCPGAGFPKSLVKGSDMELVSINWCMQMSERKSVTSSSFMQKDCHPEGLSLSHHGRGEKKKKKKMSIVLFLLNRPLVAQVTSHVSNDS